ncbi:tyrosine-type recombinase/integrase [Niabella insulamsoli]|uniref:tyrosine-type recombinase/integrase n=1 Tax=Niabella insulamsoli TaxID=3144874 RepID=UPI0031FC53D7
MNFLKRLSKNGEKITFYYDFGRGRGQRPSTGIFVYVKPQSPEEKRHNKEALALLKVKASEAIIEKQAIGTPFMPTHKFKENFYEYFTDYVKKHKRPGNRHLQGALKHFKDFVGKDIVHPSAITENLCISFRRYLLDHFNGETPADYFSEFRRVLQAATSDRYFRVSPAEKVFSKRNPSTQLKDFLEAEEYLELMDTPCPNEQVQLAFMFACYTGLRWVDIEMIKWSDIQDNKVTTRIIQQKTGRPVVLTLHPVALAIVKKMHFLTYFEACDKFMFRLPSRRTVGVVMDKWVARTSIKKHIRPSSARLTFSILLQDKLVDDATVASLLGHTTTEQVRKIYKRHRPKNAEATISQLPTPKNLPYYLEV